MIVSLSARARIYRENAGQAGMKKRLNAHRFDASL